MSLSPIRPEPFDSERPGNLSGILPWPVNSNSYLPCLSRIRLACDHLIVVRSDQMSVGLLEDEMNLMSFLTNHYHYWGIPHERSSDRRLIQICYECGAEREIKVHLCPHRVPADAESQAREIKAALSPLPET